MPLPKGFVADKNTPRFVSNGCIERNHPPEKPEEILTYSGGTLWSGSLDFEVLDTIAIVLNTNGLQIFDITDLSMPVLLRNIYLGRGSSYDLMHRNGVHLFVGRYDRVYVLDVSIPHDPQRLSVITLPGRSFDVEIIGDRAYMGMLRTWSETATGYPALCVFDMSDPAGPSLVGKYESPWPQIRGNRRLCILRQPMG